jgi:hypothetical protein
VIRVSIAIVAAAVIIAPIAATAEDLPDHLGIEWQGKKICEKLFEDAQIRILRCTIEAGVTEPRHSAIPEFGYVLSGGKGQVVDAKGMHEIEARGDEFWTSGSVPWHEYTNIGSTTQRFLLVEKKY